MNHRFAPLLSALVLAAASTPDPPDSAIWRRKHSRYQTTGNLILLFPGSRVASGMGSSARTARAANARRRSRRKIQRQSPLAKRRIRERVRHPRQGRLGVALGGRAETVMGLTGAGDLILTATGDLSRNRRVGLELARGRPLQAVVAGLGHVAEGVRSAHATLARASSRAVAMPITAAVNAVLEGSLTPQQAVELLLARDPRGE